MQQIKSSTTNTEELSRRLDGLEQAASAIRGITAILTDDRIQQDDDGQVMNSPTYGGLMHALESISDQINCLADQIYKSHVYGREAAQ